jgi:arylsulfatase A-like enzyme
VKRPNLVFIMTDHQRADSINMIQDGQEITPNLNKLAKESTVFTRAYNACPLCVPARTALATGKSPLSNGMFLNDVNGVYAKEHKTIHEYVCDMGYEVAHIGVHHIRVKPDIKEALDFKLWIDEEDHEEYAKSKGIEVKRRGEDQRFVLENQEGIYVKRSYSNERTSIWEHELEDFKDIYFVRKAIEFINGEHQKPFAVFLYFWAPHPPLIVPEPYASKFKPENIQRPDNVGIIASGEPGIRRKGAPAQLADGINEETWRKVWAAHLGLVNMTDEAIGKVIDVLKDKNIYEDTVIVFTSDHGDHLGQHSMYQKMEMYEQAIRVPAVFRVPGGKGHRLETPVSHIDFLPTVMDLINGSVEDSFEGKSLKDCIYKGIDPEERDVFSVYSGNQKKGDIRRAVISGEYKYIYDAAKGLELYNLKEDPLEMNNLASNNNMKDLLLQMHSKLRAWGEKHGDYILYEEINF